MVVYGEFGPLSLSLGSALYPVFTVSRVTLVFCPFHSAYWLLYSKTAMR